MPANRSRPSSPRHGSKTALKGLDPLLKPMRADYLSFIDRPIPDPIRGILGNYANQGGDLERLCFLLWLLSYKKRTEHGGILFNAIQPRKLKARLAHCEESIQDLIDLLPGLPLPIYYYLGKALQEVQRVSRSPAAQKKICGLGKKQAAGKAGRKRGFTLDSLILALITHDFRLRFGQSCYQDVLTLIQETVPEKLPPTITTKHLRQRVQSVPTREVQAHHPLLSPSP